MPARVPGEIFLGLTAFKRSLTAWDTVTAGTVDGSLRSPRASDRGSIHQFAIDLDSTAVGDSPLKKPQPPGPRQPAGVLFCLACNRVFRVAGAISHPTRYHPPANDIKDESTAADSRTPLRPR